MIQNLAWAAGLFEGEGSISANGRMRIKMTDRDVLILFRLVVQCGTVHGPYQPSGLGKKLVYEWTVQGKDAFDLMADFQLFMGERRSKRIIEVLETKYNKKHKKLSPKDVQSIRERISAGVHGINRALAEEYGVSDGLISAIKHRRMW